MRPKLTEVLPLLLAACGPAPGAESAIGARWEVHAPVPEARTEVSVTADDSLIYLIGGFGEGPGASASAPRAMFAYDPVADRWTAAGEIPEGVNHAGFAAVGGKLHVVGGFREQTFSPTGSVRIYDPAARAWRDGAPMLTPRGALAVAVVDGKIHAIGGNAADGAGLAPHEHGAPQADNSVATHEEYDPATDAWTSPWTVQASASCTRGRAILEPRVPLRKGQADVRRRGVVHHRPRERPGPAHRTR